MQRPWFGCRMLLYVGLFWIFLCMLVPAAFRWGGWPERVAAMLYLGAALLSVLLRPALGVKFHVLDWSLVAIDVSLLAGLLAIALWADRWWPIAATALQAVATLAHVAKTINPGIYALGYQLMEESSAYPTLIILALAIFRARQRYRRATSSS